MILGLDVNQLLSGLLPSKVYHSDFVLSILPSVTQIVLPDWTCNDNDYTVFDFSRFTQVESINIGNDCFFSVQTFKIDGLNRLKTIEIGKNSFTQKKNGNYGDEKSKSFHILNCESLESIQIDEYSFSDFGGEFDLKNLPKLKSIQIGIIGSTSCNFFCGSFVIRGIEMNWIVE